MSMDWSSVKALSIPVGGVSRDVKRVSVGGTVLWEKPNPPPYDAEVEYLESTGTQWVDTGLTINTATDEIRASCQMIGTTAYRYLFGVMQPGAYFGVGRDDSNTYLLYASGAASKPLSYITGGRHEILSNSNGLSIDGATMFPFSPFASTASIHLFNLNRPGNTNNYKSASRLYGFKVVRNGTTVMDLQPVRVGSGADAVGCLYNRLGTGGQNPDGTARTDGLYFNRGSGAFVVGPDYGTSLSISPFLYLEETDLNPSDADATESETQDEPQETPQTD